MRKILIIIVTFAFAINATNAQTSHFSFAVKGGVNHFYDNAPRGYNNYPFNFTGGAEIEFSFNRLLGLGVEYMYLDRDREITSYKNNSTITNLTAENHDFSGFLTLNLTNLFAPKRIGRIWNLYAKAGAGASLYHYKNEKTGKRVYGNDSKHALVIPAGLLCEFNVTKYFAVFAEGQYRWYNKGDMSGFGVDCKSSKAWMALLGVRYKFSANKQHHIKNGKAPLITKEIVEEPSPVYKEEVITQPEIKREEPKPEKEKPMPQPEPKPVITEEEHKIINEAYENLQFDTNKSTIKSVSYPSLNNLAGMLLRNPNSTVYLAGHTDSTGRREYNINLSKNRAEAVKTYLVNKGVSEANITTEGFGPDKPIDTNTTATGRALNRRVEINVTKM